MPDQVTTALAGANRDNQVADLKPKNQVAEQLLAKLVEIGRTVTPGFFGGHFHCTGVPVKDLPDACLLGIQLGKDFGVMGWERIGPQQYVIFRDAHVSR